MEFVFLFTGRIAAIKTNHHGERTPKLLRYTASQLVLNIRGNFRNSKG